MRIPIVAACCAALRAAFGGGIACLVALTALAQPVPPISANTAKGKALIDLNGRRSTCSITTVRANRIAMPNAPSIGCP